MTTLIEELKPCPFCGSAAKLWQSPNYFGVECTAKSFACVSMPACFEDGESATKAWNTRQHEPEPVSLEKCAEALWGKRILSEPPTEEEIEMAAIEVNPSLCGRGQNYSEIAMTAARATAKAVLQSFMGESDDSYNSLLKKVSEQKPQPRKPKKRDKK